MSIVDLSAFHTFLNIRMVVVLKGYYDGSGLTERDDRITLAGYVASTEVWIAFEKTWMEVLHGFEIPCKYLHMVEASGLRDEFSIRKGWTKSHVARLLRELKGKCLAQYGWGGEDLTSLFGVHCTIEKLDFERACKELPSLEGKNHVAVCAEFVAWIALRRLPQDPDKPDGHRIGTVELFFDRGEPFYDPIKKAWDDACNRPKGLRGPLSMIKAITSVNEGMKLSPALQAADYLAWHINRKYTRNCQIAGWNTSPFICPGVGIHFDYKTLIEWYGGGRRGLF